MLADELLKKRKDRAVAIVMNIIERDIHPLLNQLPEGKREPAKRKLRKVILDQFNDFYDMARDVALSGEAATFWFNDEEWEHRFEVIWEQATKEDDDARPVTESN